MADNDLTVSEDTSENPVTVTVDIPTDTPEPDEPDTTIVVVEAPDDDADALDAVEVQAAIDHEGRIAALEGDIGKILGILEAQSETIHEVQVEQEIQEVIQEAVVEEVVEDSTPDEPDIKPDSAKTHWFFRPAHEWLNK